MPATIKKRPLSSSENAAAASGPALKQTKLVFGAGNELKLEASPTKPVAEVKPLPRSSSEYFEHAVAPIRDTTWFEKIEGELSKSYMQEVFKKLDAEAKANKVIFPPIDLIFNAFILTPFEKVRVVIIGQDPYHNDGQAHGLSFSVPPGIKQPPSLKNIFKEIAKEYPGFKPPPHGSLIKWAEQGVFLLNASLTVEKNNANSHSKFGWQKFTDFVINTISRELTGVVFLLWGNFAHKKADLIDQSKHIVIKTAHPSPLSYAKFVDCKCFTKVNESLEKMGRDPIDWTDL